MIETGGLRIEVIHTPGHCADHCALAFNGTDVLTADVLFKGTVGGTRAPGRDRVRRPEDSVMDKLMKLPPETADPPRPPRALDDRRRVGARTRSSASGAGSTRRAPSRCSIGPADADEREPRRWSSGRPTTTAATRRWVRFEDGSDAIVGGSQVKREG